MTPMPLRSPCMRWLALCLFSSSVIAASPDGVVAVSHPAEAADPRREGTVIRVKP
ncbi:MAG: hypothetical protein WCB97_10490 [Thiobacillus sp.]